MKVTINDVAELAGVSIKTVSRVINKEPSVRQKTYDVVMAAVNELNYQPNLAARNLAGSSAFAIGLVYDNPNAYYVLDMQNGVLSRCRDEGYELVIHPCHYADKHMPEELKTMIKRSRIAGLVLTPPLSEQNDIIAMLGELNVPYVRILSGQAQEADAEQSDCIFVNDYAAAFEITSHLLALGHKRIAFLSGDEEHKSTTERQAGYRDALAKYNVAIDPNLVIKGEYSFESGVNRAKTLLSDNNPHQVSAIVGANDEIAAGALFAARLMDINVPGQLSIAGFEDSPFSRQTWPKLTTAHQENDVIAQHAARLLFAKTRGKRNQDKEIQLSFTPSMVVRDSTGPQG